MNDEPVPAFVPVWDVRRIQTFTADGNLKGGRFGQRRPQLRRHRSHRALLLRQRQQPVLARAARRQPPFCPRAGVPAYPGQPGLPPPTSDLRARVPQGRRRRDRHMGGVHGFPVEGAFIAVDGPENFSLGSRCWVMCSATLRSTTTTRTRRAASADTFTSGGKGTGPRATLTAPPWPSAGSTPRRTGSCAASTGLGSTRKVRRNAGMQLASAAD
jgi:hypothetical protein